MKRRVTSIVSLLAFLSGFGATTQASANFSVSNAAGTTIVRQDDPAADLIGTQVRVQAGLDRQSPAQNGLAALVAQAILQTPVTGVTSLRDAVAANGGSIAYDIGPHDVRFYLEGTPGAYQAALGLFRSALAHPDFSAAALDQARTALNARSAQTQQFALAVGLQMLNRTFYKNSNAGMPPLGLPQTLAGFRSSDARGFFAAHYLRGGAVVSTVGKIQGVPAGAFDDILNVLPAGSSGAAKVTTADLSSNSRQLIARRDIPVPWLVAQYKAPDLHGRDFGAMLVLTSLLQRTLADVAGVPSLSTPSLAQRGVGAIYNFDSHPANVVVYVDGGGDPTRVFATALTIVNVLGHAKLQGDLSDMKTFAIGSFLEQSNSLRDRAWLASVFVSQQLPPDYVAQTIAAINKVTAAELQRVAVRYLGLPNIALVLPRESQQNPSP
jgi:predicted Zn-dependent peptidase